MFNRMNCFRNLVAEKRQRLSISWIRVKQVTRDFLEYLKKKVHILVDKFFEWLEKQAYKIIDKVEKHFEGKED